MNQQPTISPREGFRYKIRNGLVTQKMLQRLDNSQATSEYPFITLVKEITGDINVVTYTYNGCFHSDEKYHYSNHPYDIVEELPIEWSDFDVHTSHNEGYDDGFITTFNGVTVRYLNNRYLVFTDGNDCVLHYDSQPALEYIRNHFFCPTKPDPNIERMKSDIKDMEDKLNDMKSTLNRMETQ